MSIRSGLPLLFLLASLPALAGQGAVNLPDVEPDAQVARVCRQLDQVHQTVTGLQAEVTQVKRSALLADAVISRGIFRYQAPDKVRWDYGAPDPMVMLVANGILTMYYPDLKRADVVDVGRYQSQVFQVMAIGQSSKILHKHYDIEYLGRHEPGVPGGTVLLPEEMAGDQVRLAPPEEAMTVLELRPKRRRLRRRVNRLRVWFSEKSWYPVLLWIEEESGDTSLVRFQEFQISPIYPEGTFQLEFPEDVRIEHPGRRGKRSQEP